MVVPELNSKNSGVSEEDLSPLYLPVCEVPKLKASFSGLKKAPLKRSTYMPPGTHILCLNNSPTFLEILQRRSVSSLSSKGADIIREEQEGKAGRYTSLALPSNGPPSPVTVREDARGPAHALHMSVVYVRFICRIHPG